MEWFKWLLVGLFGVGALINVWTASRGKHMSEKTPGAQTFSAILNTLLAIGVILWL